MSNKAENEVKSAAQIADDRRKEEERKKREEAAEREQIRKQAEAIACKFVRIAGVWKKKCLNTDGELVLERYSASDIIADYGKKLGSAILLAAPKCINSVNIPEHINYQEIITTASQDSYYNTYYPLKYMPCEGDWSTIEELMRHIFGEQYEKGLDYVELMYISPKTRLPILVLVSTENKTGKSTFCNLMREIFGQNAKAITKDTIDNRFNSAWATKLLAYCEETLVDKAALLDKIKNYATAEVVPTEKKGYDMQNEKVYLKLIMCSNNELHPTIIDKEDTRHWVRKVPVILNNPGKSFAEKCKQEIPAFLYFLQNRKLSTSGTDRLWFTPEETVTDAWRRIVANSKEKDELEIIFLLQTVLEGTGKNKIEYSISELLLVIKDKNTNIVSENTKRNISAVRLKEILRGWGFSKTSRTKRHDVYAITQDGQMYVRANMSSRAFVFTKDFVKALAHE